ncbi:hypothetical protein C6496_12540 [Candidatus Poribacteria bacterium]|nr:MAG: hypothetical protein C6496_12540 [Candidatus Poribacteria bacterium]
MLKTTPLQNRITTILLIVLLLLINLNRVIFADVNQLLFHSESFKDLGSLAVKLQDKREVFSKSLASQFSAKTQQLLMEYDGENTPSPALQQGILMDLNKLLQESVLYNEQHFTSIPLSKYTQQLLSQNPKSGENLIRLNRFLLADAYPQELVSPLEQLVEAARTLLGDEFFETQEGKDLLKNITRQPAASSDSKELNSDDPPQPITTKRSSQKTFHVRSAEDLAALREQLGDEFFETQEGKDLLKHLATLPSGSEKVETQISIGTSMPDFVFTNRSGETVKLEQFHDKFILLNLFSVDCVSCGPDLQHLEKQLENADLSQLQIVGIILGDPAEALAGFEKKYQLSMPLWIDKKSVILNFLNSDTVQPQTKLITILLNPEMVVEEIFTDKPTLSQKVKTLVKPKE